MQYSTPSVTVKSDDPNAKLNYCKAIAETYSKYYLEDTDPNAETVVNILGIDYLVIPKILN